ncbi:unnamed protein product [Leptosia nina]|uniref:E3 ubiquitin-protein ligase Topors n=1 Tax=Leptosia nina TaxID=320188 RepID=A0AAV1ITG1_9NEOP
METLSTTSQGDSSIKSEDSSPQQESGRSSPPPNCAICLGTCKNKSFTDSCLHQFCFRCILRWSKVKAECPLCKQIFKSIIHNVRSNSQYEEYMVEQRTQVEDIERIEIDNISNAAQRFRFRATLTLPSRDSWAIEQILLNRTDARRQPPAHRRRQPSYFRRTVYRHNLWARPLPDFTGRYRDCTPEFYRYNNSQMHRLVPWLTRELHYLLNENVQHICFVMSQIMELLPSYHINSSEFREATQRYFGDRTEHFLHELYCFASTPYDMAGYDRNVQYTTDSRVSTMINEIISSSDNDSSLDSDINIEDFLRQFPISSQYPAGSSQDVPRPQFDTVNTNPPTNDVIPIETISHSDTDDNSSEVMVVGYIKPPHARTPEVVDLLESDSDVVIEDDPQPSTTVQPQTSQSQESRSVSLVKVTLKQHHPTPAATIANFPTATPATTAPTVSDSDDSTYTPPLPRRKRPSSDTNSSSTKTSSSSESEYRTPSSSTVSYYSSSSSSVAYSSSDSCSSDSYTPRAKKVKRKKTKRKSSNDKSKKKLKRSKSKSKNKKSKSESASTKDTSRKSNSGIGVKSSKSTNSERTQFLDQPSTSGTQNRSKSNKRKMDSKRSSNESKRLRSAISVVTNQKHLRSSGSETSQANSSKPNSVDEGTTQAREKPVPENVTNSSVVENSDTSESETHNPYIDRIIQYLKNK